MTEGDNWRCNGCCVTQPNKKSRLVPEFKVPAFMTVLEGTPVDLESYRVCSKCWRLFWAELKRANPVLEGGMPF